jgi:hypothetical protein
MTWLKRKTGINGLLSVVLAAFFILPGCTMTGGSSTESMGEDRRTVERVIQDLERHYEREDPVGFIRMVHDDYSGAMTSRGDLRSRMDIVFRRYQRIRLDFYGTRANRNKNTINATTQWNLQWTCQQAGDFDGDGNDECDSRSQVIRRSGRTTLGFQKGEEGWKLIQQRDDALFGDLTPGLERARVPSSP